MGPRWLEHATRGSEEDIDAERLRALEAVRKVSRTKRKSASHVHRAVQQSTLLANGMSQTKRGVVSEMFSWPNQEGEAVRCLSLEQVGSFEQKVYQSEHKRWRKLKKLSGKYAKRGNLTNLNRARSLSKKGGMTLGKRKIPREPRKPSREYDACPDSLRMENYGAMGNKRWKLAGQFDDDSMTCCYAQPPYRDPKAPRRKTPSWLLD